jgi:hypothetical protein
VALAAYQAGMVDATQHHHQQQQHPSQQPTHAVMHSHDLCMASTGALTYCQEPIKQEITSVTNSITQLISCVGQADTFSLNDRDAHQQALQRAPQQMLQILNPSFTIVNPIQQEYNHLPLLSHGQLLMSPNGYTPVENNVTRSSNYHNGKSKRKRSNYRSNRHPPTVASILRDNENKRIQQLQLQAAQEEEHQSYNFASNETTVVRIETEMKDEGEEML